MPSSLSLLVALAASASASIHFNAAVPVLAARQETPQPTAAKQTINPECKSVLMTFPTPPPEIKAEFMKNRPTDICAFSTPASISSQVASYSSIVSAWGTDNNKKLGACSRFSKLLAFTACDKKLVAATTQANAAAAVGTQMSGMSGMNDINGNANGGSRNEGGMGGSNVAESDKDKNAKTSMSTITRAGNAAPQKTGLAMAAVAAAGFALAL